jgi:hypothetical protein
VFHVMPHFCNRYEVTKPLCASDKTES